MVIGLVISWGAFQGMLVVPWIQLSHALLDAVRQQSLIPSYTANVGIRSIQMSKLWVALCEVWSRGAHTAVNTYSFVSLMVRGAISFVTSWARAQALQALGLPPDILERLPPN